ncbi:MAG: hypothetical protein IKY83_12330, partial [Proteobacteria bacterium]|nr:hypothetical protein [Pseudomonadota bacterium]
QADTPRPLAALVTPIAAQTHRLSNSPSGFDVCSPRLRSLSREKAQFLIPTAFSARPNIVTIQSMDIELGYCDFTDIVLKERRRLYG